MTWFFLVLAVIMALFAFTGLATGVAGVANVLFWIFAVLFLVTLFARMFRRGPTGHQRQDVGHDVPRGPR